MIPEQENILTSLLQKISREELSDILFEENLRKSDYNFYYFIDFFDIHRFCFPMGFTRREPRREESLEIITDEQAAYSFFFNELSKHVMVFDEYTDEIWSFENALSSWAEEVEKAVIRTSDDIIEYVNKYGPNFEKLQDSSEISSFEISMFLSVALGLTGIGFKRFHKLEREHLIITGNKLRTIYAKDNLRIVDQILSTRPKKNITEFIFKLWSEQNRSEYDLRKRANVYRDCKAIDRILQLNYESIKSGSKTLFIMLSSAPFFHKISRNLKREKWLPEIDKIRFNPFRTCSQIYYKMIAGKFQNDEIANALFNTFNESAIYQTKKYSFLSDEVLINFKNVLDQARKGFENAALLLYDELYELLEGGIKDPKIKANQDLVKSFRAILNYKNQQKQIQEIKENAANKIIFEFNFRTSLIYGLRDIEIRKKEFRVVIGLDFITGHFHILPLHFEVKDYNYSEILREIASYCLAQKHHRLESLILFGNISTRVERLFDNVQPNLTEILIQCIVLLILPDNRDEKAEDNLGLEKRFLNLENEIDNLIEREPISHDELVLHEVENILNDEKYINEFNGKEKKNHLNYLHLASSIARRICKYHEAIDFANKGLMIKKSDGRFNHDLCLIYYDIFMEGIQNNESKPNIEALNNSIFNAEAALKFYGNRINTPRELYKSLTIAIKNTLAYLLCLKFEYTKKNPGNSEQLKNILRESRKLISQIKKELGKEKYEEYHEFLHTEANLEFLEFKAFKDHGKINNANIAIDKSNELLLNCNYVKGQKLSFFIKSNKKLIAEIKKTARK